MLLKAYLSDNFRCVFRKIFFTNLGEESTSQSVTNYFKQFGDVVEVRIFPHPTGEWRGIGSVEFGDQKIAQYIIQVGRHMIDGYQIKAKPYNSKV